MTRFVVLTLVVAACGAPASRSLPTAHPTVTPTAVAASGYCLAGTLPKAGDVVDYPLVRAAGVAECHGLFASAAAASATTRWLSTTLTTHTLTPAEAAEAARTQPSFLGPPARLIGNAETGPSLIQRAPGSDAVAIFFQTTFEGEPGMGTLWVLDGVTETAMVTPSWGFAFEPGGRRVIYSVQHLLEDDTTDQKTDHRAAVAAQIGVAPDQLARFAFQDGFTGNTWLCQPVRARLGQLGVEPVAVAGGCELALDGQRIVAYGLPTYFSPRSGPDPVPQVLQLDPPHLVSVVEAERARVAALFARPSAGDPDQESPPIGKRIAMTENGRLAMIVVGPRWAVQVARLPR